MSTEIPGGAPDTADRAATRLAAHDAIRDDGGTFDGLVPPPEHLASRPRRDACPPAAIGRYTITGELGRGGLGVVYRGFDPVLKRAAAVKVVLSGRYAGAELTERLRTEAEVVARLDHPNIIRIYDVGEADGVPYLALELVDGPDLAAVLAAAPLTPSAAAELLEPLSRAVAHAHGSGVIHRDLKPANVLLSGARAEEPRAGAEPERPALVPKVADFGLAKYAGYDSGLTATGAVLGTPSYMAPEQAEGAPDRVGPAADVWALGAILYECLTGRPPFRAAHALETLQLIRAADPVPPRRLQPSIPRDLEIICLKCLEKDPARRYPTAAELAEDLRRFRAGEPILARPASPAVRAIKWCRRNRAATGLLAGAAAALVAGIAGVLWHNVRLQRALDDVTAKEAEVRRERDRADGNYREARSAIDRILHHYTGRDLAEVPRVRELRRRQAEDALAFFEKVAEQAGETPEVRYDVARAHYDAGRLRFDLGQRSEAESNFRQALERLTALVEQFPDDPKYRRDRADVLNHLAAVCSPDEGERRLREALTDGEAVLAAEPGSAADRSALAATYSNLGGAFYGRGQLDEAERYYRTSAELHEAAAAAEPDRRSFRLGLAKTVLNLSVLNQQRKDGKAEARRDHDRAEGLFEQLAREDPTDSDTLYALAVLRVNWAYVLAGQKRYEEALAELGKNFRELEPVLHNDPDYREVRDALYRSYGVVAQIRDGQENWKESVAAWRKVVELAPAEVRTRQRMFLARALVQAGDHAAAVAATEEVTAGLPPTAPWGEYIHLATVVAIARQKAAAEPKGVGQAERVERYAKLGVSLLAKAKASAGPQEWRKAYPELLLEPIFWPIVTRADARQALAPDLSPAGP